jgi:hypothetical protein
MDGPPESDAVKLMTVPKVRCFGTKRHVRFIMLEQEGNKNLGRDLLLLICCQSSFFGQALRHINEKVDAVKNDNAGPPTVC